MHVCMCVCVSVCVQVHFYDYTHILMYTHMFMYVCMYICVQPPTKAMAITFIFKNIYLPSHVLSLYLFMHPYNSKSKLF